MTVSRSKPPFLALLASAAVLPLTSSAQPAPAAASQAEREIAITGAADAPPVVVYGAPNLSVMVSFDSPLKKDGIVAPQGADVRPHPFVPNAIAITPSSSLTAQTPILVSVPLADGTVVLTVAFSPPRRDTSVRIVRRATSTARPAVTVGELKELLLLSASKVLDTGACASADGAAAVRPVAQGEHEELTGALRVRGGGAFAYLSVRAREGCTPATARLSRGEESTEVLLLAPHAAASSDSRTFWLVVARAPLGDGGGFTLELLAEDGAPCLSKPVNLKPSSP